MEFKRRINIVTNHFIQNLCTVQSKRVIDSIIYRTPERALNVLRRQEFAEHKGCQRLLEIYGETKKKYGKFIKSNKKCPLVVVEGLDGCGKSTALENFSRKINAIKRANPPRLITDIRAMFDAAPVTLRAAYYTLGNYLASMTLSKDLTFAPVVLDRYWHSTAAFHLAQAVHDGMLLTLPKVGEDVYNWPVDMLKPDVVFFFSVSEDVRVERLRKRQVPFTKQEKLLINNSTFRNNVLQAYSQMYNPGVTSVNANLSPDGVVAELERRFSLIQSKF